MKYKDATRRVRVCTKQDTIEVESILAPVIECLTSAYYLSVFKKIELTQAKAASGGILSNRNLAAKHSFFMRECPEFLIQHGHHQAEQVNELLGKKMLQNTVPIFNQYLPLLTQHDGKWFVENDLIESQVTPLIIQLEAIERFSPCRLL